MLVVDPDPARAALVAEGLAGVQPLEVRQAPVFDPHDAAVFEPDVIVVASASPDRDTIGSLREASQANPRPVVMFVDAASRGSPRRRCGPGSPPMWWTGWRLGACVACSRWP